MVLRGELNITFFLFLLFVKGTRLKIEEIFFFLKWKIRFVDYVVWVGSGLRRWLLARLRDVGFSGEGEYFT